MKTSMKWTAIGLVVLFVSSCSQGPKGNKVVSEEVSESLVVEGSRLDLDLGESVIEWTGSKPLGTHSGTVRLSEGYFIAEGDQITGGSFVIDLNSMRNIDLTDDGTNAKLIGHLKSSDFFNVDSFPTARFELTGIYPKEELQGVEGEFVPTHEFSGNLTIKDISRTIRFTGKIVKEGSVYMAESNSFTIDRTEWGVNYGSRKIFDNLKDQFINDEIGFQVRVVSRPADF